MRDELGVLIAPAAVAEMATRFEDTGFVDAVQAFRGVRMLSHRMSEAAATWLAPHGLTVAQYNFLAALFWQDGRSGLPSREIGRHLHTTSGTVTAMTDTLERAGLVARTAHATDRRSVLVRLTARGRRKFVEAAETHHARAVEALAGLDEREVRTLLELLVRAGNALAAHIA